MAQGIAGLDDEMNEREEFEKWWKDVYPKRSPSLLDAFQAGRHSRQKQDIEICSSVAERYNEIAKTPALYCAVKIDETP